jgi:branched-chain amino acid transport system substrate-binding protein
MMQKLVLAALTALGLALAVGACGGSDKASTNSTGTATSDASLSGSVKIGSVLPVTGGAAPSGKDEERGVQLAVERVNADGGVLGKRLVVEVEDSQADPVAAVQAARKLVTVDKVPVIVGEFQSASTIAMGKYLQSAGVVTISPGATSPDVRRIGDWFFSTIGLGTLSARFAAEKLHDAGYRSIAFLAPNTPAGTGIARDFKADFEQLGGEVPETVIYEAGKSDYRAELQRLQKSGAELYANMTYVPESPTIMRNAFELGIKPEQWYGTYLSLVAQDVDPQAVAGQQGQDLSYTGATGDDFKAAYKARFGQDIQTPYSSMAYDGVMLAAAAINKARSLEPAAIRTALKEVGRDFPGASGPITFDAENQRAEQEYALLQIDADGKLAPQRQITGPAE